MTTKNAAYYTALGTSGALDSKPKSGWQLKAWQEGYAQHLVNTGRTVVAKIEAAKNAPKVATTHAYGHPMSGNKSFERHMRKTQAMVSRIQHRQRLAAIA